MLVGVKKLRVLCGDGPLAKDALPPRRPQQWPMLNPLR